MFLIKENSFNTDNPVYTKINSDDGHRMIIPVARVAKDYFFSGYYERGFLDFVMNNFIESDKNVLDIGAHIGWYSIEFASKAKHVYSFECSPKSFNYLCANIALNNYNYKISKYQTALGNTSGEIDYYIRDSGDGGANGLFVSENDSKLESLKVPITTLDSFNIKDLSFIKLDVEGFEKNVLEGAIETIVNNNYPPILFESWDESRESQGIPAKKLRQELFSYIKQIGYTKIISFMQCNEIFLAVKE